jgi:hypothetical protein
MIGNTVRGFIFDAGYIFGAHCKQLDYVRWFSSCDLLIKGTGI